MERVTGKFHRHPKYRVPPSCYLSEDQYILNGSEESKVQKIWSMSSRVMVIKVFENSSITVRKQE